MVCRADMKLCFVFVAVETVDHSGITCDDVLHRCADRDLGVDVPGGIVAGSAYAIVGGQDVRPVLHRMAVGARLQVNLT